MFLIHLERFVLFVCLFKQTNKKRLVLLSKVTLDVQDGSVEVRASLVGGQARIISCVAPFETGNSQ